MFLWLRKLLGHGVNTQRMAKDFERDAFAENERDRARHEWFEARKSAIRQTVSAYDVLGRHGVHLRKGGNQDEQFSCPFHGADNRPSARYYPDSVTSKSHVWCFKCHEKGWDAIGLWRKFNPGDKFSMSLFQMERAFGITVPEFQSAPLPEDEYDPEREEVYNLLDICDQRLVSEKVLFTLPSYLKLGAALDRIRFDVDRGALSLSKAKDRLTQVLDKIGEKVRAKAIDTPDP